MTTSVTILVLVLGVVVGLAGGVAVAAVLAGRRSKAAAEAAVAAVRDQAAADRDAAVRAALDQVGALASQALAAQATAVQRELAGRSEVIDARLGQVQSEVRHELDRLGQAVGQLRELSAASLAELRAQLEAHAQSTASLATTAQGIREALASPKARGQWGERMAEDVLRLAGFIEHVNYEKQTATEAGGGIPDFTFTLPKGHVLYMDVKFPMASYLRYLDAETEAERVAHRTQFLRDVRLRVKELASREYTARAAKTIDYVLLFIPNEAISGFVHEHDASLIDDALRSGVVLCSPLTLFAMLGVIRQAHDAFLVEQTSDEILRVVGAFDKQWAKFTEALDTVEKRLESLTKAYGELNGPRRRQLERPVAKLQELRQSRGLAADPLLSPGADVVTLERPGIAELGA